jgi:aryl-alcohol dehydrogenase-like predicted oxidoreductase
MCRRVAPYLALVERLDSFARSAINKRVIHRALCWVLDQSGVSGCLWGARRPGQPQPVAEVMDWELDTSAKADSKAACIVVWQCAGGSHRKKIAWSQKNILFK